MSRLLTYVAVFVLLERHGRYLLMRRANTGYRDGMYTIPSGHAEPGEMPAVAAARELMEEVGVVASVDQLEFVHVVYRIDPDRTYNDYVFVCREWQGEPANMEQEKCDDLKWVDHDALPENMVPEVLTALRGIVAGRKYSELRT